MKKVVVDGSDGDLYVLDEQKAGNMPYSLTRARAKHRSASVTMQLGATAAMASTNAWAFIWPKSGNQRLYWVTFALYGNLKMTSYHNQPSKCCFSTRCQCGRPTSRRCSLLSSSCTVGMA